MALELGQKTWKAAKRVILSLARADVAVGAAAEGGHALKLQLPAVVVGVLYDGPTLIGLLAQSEFLESDPVSVRLRLPP